MPDTQQFRPQTTFCNRTETNVREANWLLIYEKSRLTFNQNFRGEFPDPNDYLFRVRVQDVRGFNRSFRNRFRDHNRFREIAIQAEYFTLDKAEIKQLQAFAKTNAYVIVLVTNEDLQVFGNHRQGVSFDIEDNISDNASGNDSYVISLIGNTTVNVNFGILPEQIQNEFFKVLLYASPKI